MTALLTPEQVAEILHLKINTLAVWRSNRRYELPFIKAGRRIRYRASDVENFLQKQTVDPAAENGGK